MFYRRIREIRETYRKDKDHMAASRDLFAKLVSDEEEHVDWLEAQLTLIEQMGESNYLQSQT